MCTFSFTETERGSYCFSPKGCDEHGRIKLEHLWGTDLRGIQTQERNRDRTEVTCQMYNTVYSLLYSSLFGSQSAGLAMIQPLGAERKNCCGSTENRIGAGILWRGCVCVCPAGMNSLYITQQQVVTCNTGISPHTHTHTYHVFLWLCFNHLKKKKTLPQGMTLIKMWMAAEVSVETDLFLIKEVMMHVIKQGYSYHRLIII